jgi:hypothetical protein
MDAVRPNIADLPGGTPEADSLQPCNDRVKLLNDRSSHIDDAGSEADDLRSIEGWEPSNVRIAVHKGPERGFSRSG